MNCLGRAVFGIELIASLLLLNLSLVQAQTSGLSEIVDRLVTAYNNQDAGAYRESFGKKLKDEFSLQDIQDVLSSNMKTNGPIISHITQLSPDGKRALVFLEMEKDNFDVHIRKNNENKIERLFWFPHKVDPSINAISGHDQHLILEKLQPFIDKFVQAIRDTNAEAIMSLLVEDEDDDWTVDDYHSFLVQMNDRGLKEVGDIEVLALNRILIPMYFETGDMGFYLEFNNVNKISNLRISNYAPSDTRGLSYTLLGADTLKTLDLKSFDQLRDAFASDSGKVRFIALLSPT